ncbi:tRNA threonylcarbamoyladenosine dehydratase [bacterium]|nr:tRNA threonylcarbamoyladenosine dehydratase [bacterium]
MPDIPKEYQYERLIRLIGADSYQRLSRAHVLIMGTGGVGSWATEALARLNIGHFTLVDYDTVRPSNINRQLIALPRHLGRLKCEVMRERILEINPEAQVICLPIKYLPARSDEVWSGQYDAIVDAIDNITAKCHLINQARQRQVPIVTSTGAAGRLDPSKVRIADLSHTKIDPVALQVRKKLRRDYYYPSNKSFHVPAVYSEEIPRPPADTAELISSLGQDAGSNIVDSDPDEDRPRRHAPPYGTSSFVVGTFGMFVAGKITELLLTAMDSSKSEPPKAE